MGRRQSRGREAGKPSTRLRRYARAPAHAAALAAPRRLPPTCVSIALGKGTPTTSTPRALSSAKSRPSDTCAPHKPQAGRVQVACADASRLPTSRMHTHPGWPAGQAALATRQQHPRMRARDEGCRQRHTHAAQDVRSGATLPRHTAKKRAPPPAPLRLQSSCLPVSALSGACAARGAAAAAVVVAAAEAAASFCCSSCFPNSDCGQQASVSARTGRARRQLRNKAAPSLLLACFSLPVLLFARASLYPRNRRTASVGAPGSLGRARAHTHTHIHTYTHT